MFYKVEYGYSDSSEMQKKLNEIYDFGNDISTKTFLKKRLNLLYETIEELISENAFPSFKSALDIGSNAGVGAKIISDFGFEEVLGIDIEEDYVERAKKRFEFSNGKKLEFKKMYAEELSGMNRKFDLILCSEVIEHTLEPDKVIASIKNMLVPGGIAIVSLPNKINLNFFAAMSAKKILGRSYGENLDMHIKYPFYRSLSLFKSEDIKVKKTAGANIFMLDFTLPLLHKLPGFSVINKFDSLLSRTYPLKYFSQFFFMVLKKSNDK